jgi:tmRNA-binding protein
MTITPRNAAINNSAKVKPPELFLIFCIITEQIASNREQGEKKTNKKLIINNKQPKTNNQKPNY